MASFKYLLFLLLTLGLISHSSALIGSAVKKVQKDFAALTRRVTARHILVSNEEIALALKRRV